MPTKKHLIRSEDIAAENIFSIYKEVLPFVYNGESKSNPSDELDDRLIEYVHHDAYFFLMQNAQTQSDRIVFSQTEIGKDSTTILEAGSKSESLSPFDKIEQDTYHSWIDQGLKKNPAKPLFDYYRVLSKDYPPAMAGFFRFYDKTEDKSFTDEEKKIFDKLVHGLFPLICVLQSFSMQTSSYQHFKGYSDICLQVAEEYDLSEMEYKIVIELLFGNSTEDIAKRNYVSASAIKKHLRNIFKKTGTKGKVDFIGKFFTSPERAKI